MRKDILVRSVDAEAFRCAKAAAAERGVPLGTAVSEALSAWARGASGQELERRVGRDRAFVRSNWKKLLPHSGKAVVVADGRLQRVFETYEEARSFASRFDVALAFVVEGPPEERELEIGADLEVQRQP
ncbi:MAG: hypothetical protein JRN39_06585 [Nitrososphaerota archaeon]|nr:hypothetical protein [Nitrososphaerota archaeon]MDG6940049.1 hypothetical protein [Nitrososphaerota archaeon]